MTPPIDDPQGSILTAIALIANPRDSATHSLLPDAPQEALALMGSLAGCGAFLVTALAKQLGIERTDVIEALRQTMMNTEGQNDE